MSRSNFSLWEAFPNDFLDTKPTNLKNFVLGTQTDFTDQGHQAFASVNIFSRVLKQKELQDITGEKLDPPVVRPTGP